MFSRQLRVLSLRSAWRVGTGRGVCPRYLSDVSDDNPPEEVDKESISEKLAKPRGVEVVKELRAAIEEEAGVGVEGEEEEGLLGKEMEGRVERVAEAVGVDEEDVGSVAETLTDKLTQIEKESFEASRVPTNADVRSLLSSMKFESASEKKARRRAPAKFRASGVDEGEGGEGILDVKRVSDIINTARKPMQRQHFKRGNDVSEPRMLLRSVRNVSLPTTSLFHGSGLGIFEPNSCEKDPLEQKTQNPVWRSIEKERLNKLTSRTPRNGFEELIEWTKEGKMWKYPIDNECDWEDENDVGFHEHVFLEPLLDQLDFPHSGPIREFMELVIIGLTKNPFMTVQKKHDHLKWFKKYFDEKGQSIQRLYEEEQAHLKKISETSAAAQT